MSVLALDLNSASLLIIARLVSACRSPASFHSTESCVLCLSIHSHYLTLRIEIKIIACPRYLDPITGPLGRVWCCVHVLSRDDGVVGRYFDWYLIILLQYWIAWLFATNTPTRPSIGEKNSTVGKIVQDCPIFFFFQMWGSLCCHR